MKEGTKIRAFICLEASEEAIMEVARIQEMLDNARFHGKKTELENLHLTLKFLGEIPEEKINKIKERLREIKFAKFSAKFVEPGIFSFRGSPKIVWIKIGGKGVFDLQRQIDETMIAEGFKKEERFMSHMTVARIKYVTDKSNFVSYIKKLAIKKIEWEIKSFFLKKSELKTYGPIYTTLEEFKCISE